MANYLSIAVVTATLIKIIQATIEDVVPGAVVKGDLPDTRIPPPGSKVINVFPYSVSEAPQVRNVNLPTSRPESTQPSAPSLALRLHYMISFSSVDDPISLEIMMGKIISFFYAHPLCISPDKIKAVISPEGKFPQLSKSDLATQKETIKILPEYLSLEELSNLWVGFQREHRRSLQYQVSPILISGELA